MRQISKYSVFSANWTFCQLKSPRHVAHRKGKQNKNITRNTGGMQILSPLSQNQLFSYRKGITSFKFLDNTNLHKYLLNFLRNLQQSTCNCFGRWSRYTVTHLYSTAQALPRPRSGSNRGCCTERAYCLPTWGLQDFDFLVDINLSKHLMSRLGPCKEFSYKSNHLRLTKVIYVFLLIRNWQISPFYLHSTRVNLPKLSQIYQHVSPAEILTPGSIIK